MSSSAILLGLLILMATFAIGFLIGRSSAVVGTGPPEGPSCGES